MRTHLNNKLKPIAVNEVILDGAMFANYVTNLVDQINKGAMPNIEDSYTFICRAKCHHAKATAI